MNEMSHRVDRFRGDNQIDNGCLRDELDALIDTLRYVACDTWDVNDQWGAALDESDDDSTVRTNFDDDTVFTSDRTLGSSNSARRAVDLIKKHASRLGVSGADLLRNPSLIQGACNHQKSGAEDFDDHSSVYSSDASLDLDGDDNTFLSVFDDDTRYPHVAGSNRHKEGSVNTLLAADSVEIPISDEYVLDKYKIKTDRCADHLFADQGVEVLTSLSIGKEGKKPVSKLKTRLASIRFRRQTRDPANVEHFFGDEKRA
jgi:hypothetical protein